MAEVKKDIIWRIYIVLLVFILFGIAIVARIAHLQFVEGDKWKAKADSLTLSFRTIEPSRGNIYSSDGSLLATSLPRYDVHFDLMAGGITKEVFQKDVDSLAHYLSVLFRDKSKSEYKRLLKEARADRERYFLLKRNISFNEQRALRTFPIFRMGRNRGGLIIDQSSRREKPFRLLAARTIGMHRENKQVQSVGIEGAFDDNLKGVSGKRLMQRIAAGVWKPVNRDNEVEPMDGCDVITTIDLNLQDVAEHALEKQLQAHDAVMGCAVLMEVATGHIKAIANLTRTGDDIYNENFNYAIAQSTEPGSTFKLASMIALLEDGYIDVDDTIDTYNGITRFANVKLEDSHRIPQQKVTVKKAFAASLNVAISKLVNKYYARNPDDFISRLKQMRLNEPLGLQIKGEGNPRIKSTSSKDWSKVSLPYISIGYESKLTPLQLLSFYNAVANNGTMVQPLLVKEIRNKGKLVQSFNTTVLKDSICSRSTLAKARTLLEEVVQRGTASHIRHAQYTIAGKTGTAQIAQGSGGYNKVNYQASFCGYFPADKPKYSCIVVVYAPGQSVYYGASVACPVFKEIADKVYALDTELHEELQPVADSLFNGFPLAKAGQSRPAVYAGRKLGLPVISGESAWINDKSRPLSIKEQIVPNVTGMALRDAIYILESQGLTVKPVGRGAVKRQSLAPGQKVIRGQQVIIELG